MKVPTSSDVCLKLVKNSSKQSKFKNIVTTNGTGKSRENKNSNLLESRFEFEGHVSVVFGFFHDFADHSLLAVKIIIVEFLIKILEH